MSTKKKADAWIKYVYDEWLDKRGGPSFQPSVESLIAKLKRLRSDRRYFDDAWYSIQKIEELYNNISRDNKESPRMLLECGIAAHRMGNAREAIRFLNGATSTYSEDHDRAIARWFLGCIHWCLDDPVRALSVWENGLRDFHEAALKSGRGTELERWYKDRIQEMKEAIKFAADHDSPDFPRRATSSRSLNVKQHTIRTVPVIGQIPAGTPMNVFPKALDHISTDRVQINTKEYRVVSLTRGRSVVNLSFGHRYYVLHVYGNSMNQSTPEPIENGDYVIMREQNRAEDGDIVAALITGLDDRATLKRIKIQGGKILLIPESTDAEFQGPIYVERVFTGFDNEFHIRGVAIAVLKPLK